jgi:hypothetical protein
MRLDMVISWATFAKLRGHLSRIASLHCTFTCVVVGLEQMRAEFLICRLVYTVPSWICPITVLMQTGDRAIVVGVDIWGLAGRVANGLSKTKDITSGS